MIELRTDRLLLRRFRETDVDDALAYRDDEEFARYLPHIPQPFTRLHAETFVRVNMTEPWDESPTFAVVRDGHVIGTVNFEIDRANQVAMLGYAIGRAHWGIGLATEAARAGVTWAFDTHPVLKIWASTDTRNTRSIRVMEKLGMEYEGVLRGRARARDGAGDSVSYRVLRSEWLAKMTTAAG